jgi:flagellar hook protein FlgE
MDSQGYLVNIATGYKVLGWTADASGTVNTGNTISSMQIPLLQTKARATSIATLTGNLDSNIPVFTAGSTNYYNATMAIYDSLGVLHNVTIQFTKASVVAPAPVPPAVAATWNWNIINSGAGETGSGTITFDADGQYVAQTFTAPVVVPGSAGAVNITLADSTAFDLSNLTQMSNESNVSLAYQNGLSAASVQNFIVDANNGDIYAVYGNGLQDRFGRLSLATFTNPEGLTQLGKNMYSVSLNSGVGMVGWPGNGGKGTLAVGYNEGSNVDLGTEFTNMILAERGFQAASRMITTSDEMLQELVNLKR